MTKFITRDEQTNLIEQAIETRSWDMNKNKLAKSLRVRPAQAHMELLSTFYETRVSHYTSVPDLDKLERDITFARKDLERTTFHDDYYEHNEELTFEMEETVEDLWEPYAEIEDVQRVWGYEDEEVLDVVNNADDLFQARTASFVQAVLVYGEYETKKLLHLTDKQFNRKMTNAVKYIETHHDKFEDVLGIKPLHSRTQELEIEELNDMTTNPYELDPMSVSLADEPQEQPPLSESQKLRDFLILYKLGMVEA